MQRLSMLVLAAAWLLAPCAPAAAAVYDHLYRSGFQAVTDAPASDADAARFLTQATFGPTRAEIARLRGLGVGQWLDQQLGRPPTLARPWIEQVRDAMTAGGQTLSHNQRMNRWFHTAAYAPDQLRQRMAFALSQILVISDQDGTLGGEPVQVTEYWDILARNAFGNYRDLLHEVTYNPSMGKYLTHFRNRKASVPPAAPREPDENYAREIMQLFSIGLVERNLDFSPVLGGGQPLPTYNQDDITNLARVFTGFNYFNSTTISNGTNNYLPMNCIPGEHDLGAKTFLANTIPATPAQANGDPGHVICAPPRPGDGNRREVRDANLALDIIFNHPNVAPFVSRQLIQRLVTSNPSPAYIQRVAQVFENNGSGERGDLGAVARAILLDAEARTPAPGAGYGKAREPLLRLTALWRAWDAQSPAANQFGDVPMGLTSTAATLGNYGQRPLGAPTVFNFWEPDFQPPGPLAAAGLYAPEFQVIHEGTVFSVTNSLYTYSWNSWVGMTNPPADRPLLNLDPLLAQANNPAAMVAEADLRMTYGAMSPAMRSTLVNMLTFMTGASANEKARSLVYLVAMSPEYAVQR